MKANESQILPLSATSGEAVNAYFTFEGEL